VPHASFTSVAEGSFLSKEFWLQKMLKFLSRFLSARRIASAVGGVVVSRPMAKNTTSREGSASPRLDDRLKVLWRSFIALKVFQLEQIAAGRHWAL
jgi:hypothetical protein